MPLILCGFLIIFQPLQVFGTCLRKASIAGKELFIEQSPKEKAEGLRVYLEKDPQALNLLDLYQQKNKPQTYSIILGTAGTSLILSSMLFANESKESAFNRDRLFFTGVSLFLSNFIITKLAKKRNERRLIQAIDLYNRQQTPKITFPLP